MKSLFLIYGKHYAIEAGDRFSSTFDLNKGKKIRDKLVEEGLADETSFIDPGIVSVEDLCVVHTPGYINALNEDPSRFFTLSGLEVLVGPSVGELRGVP